MRTRSCDNCGNDIIDRDEILCRKCQPRTLARIRRDIREQTDRIDAAYEAFAIQARALPPSMVVPDAYARRNALLDELSAANYASH